MTPCRASLPRLVILSLTLLTAGAITAPSRAASGGSQATGNDTPFTMETAPHKKQGSRWIRVGRAGAAGTPAGLELQVNVVSLAGGPIRVGLRFAAPGESTGCVEEVMIDPASVHRFACPQPSLHPGVDYPVEIVIRTTGRKRPVEKLRLVYRFDPTQVAALQQHIGRTRTDG